jgi:CBS domain-containing protein
MQAKDVMTSRVISIEAQTPVLQVAALLREHRIGGVPVLAEQVLVGIVTERDLLHRREIGTDRVDGTSSWWRRVVGQNLEPGRYVKSHGRLARHVMNRRVVVATPETSLQQIAALFDLHRIGRVPVVSNNKLVGIVACADLVRALAGGAHQQAAGESSTDDGHIRDLLLAELARQPWWNGRVSNVLVEDGVVLFNGYVESEAQRRASQVAAENIAGVRLVRDERLLPLELPLAAMY